MEFNLLKIDLNFQVQVLKGTVRRMKRNENKLIAGRDWLNI